MKDSIHVLAPDVANKIAAGEVVERPASVVKELLENAIDAKANEITVEIAQGGLSLISVIDNGVGMSSIDAKTALLRHATSKISAAEDLFNVTTLGFRGEALPSIASVSRFELLTRRQEDLAGTRITLENSVIQHEEAAAPKGTRVIVKDLFYNTPARLKFMRSAVTEGSHILQICIKLALTRPDISIQCIRDDKLVLNTEGNGDLKGVIRAIYGKDIDKELLPVDFNDGEYRIKGYIGKSTFPRHNRRDEHFIINGRYATSSNIVHAAEESYRMAMAPRKYPFFVLNIDLPLAEVDVNVHPAKTEVRFQEDRRVYSLVMRGVNQGLNPQFNERQPIQDYKKEIREETFAPDLINKGKNSAFNLGVFEQITAGEFKGQIQASTLKESKKENLQLKESVRLPISVKREEIFLAPSLKPTLSRESIFPPLRPISQLAGTYIIALSVDTLYIFDQHAMAERILYNRLKEEADMGTVLRQILLEPLAIEFSAVEYDRVSSKWAELSELGFVLEEFGLNSLLVREVPQIDAFVTGRIDYKELFLELSSKERGLNKSDLMLKTLVTMSCKASVKANQWLPQQQMLDLISDLGKSENGSTCPHGRPTYFKMDINELDKYFNRVTP